MGMQPFIDWLHSYTLRWHDAWEIIGALGSAFAAGVAIWLATRERTDRKQADRDRDEALAAQRKAEDAAAEQRRSEQARSVHFWNVASGHNEEHDEWGEVVSHDPLLRLVVQNNSSLPVFDVQLSWRLSGGEPRTDGPRSSLSPGEMHSIDLPPDVDHTRADVRFRDTNNQRWRRYTDGALAPDDQTN